MPQEILKNADHIAVIGSVAKASGDCSPPLLSRETKLSLPRFDRRSYLQHLFSEGAEGRLCWLRTTAAIACLLAHSDSFDRDKWIHHKRIFLYASVVRWLLFPVCPESISPNRHLIDYEHHVLARF
jgi:hypothetical protein